MHQQIDALEHLKDGFVMWLIIFPALNIKFYDGTDLNLFTLLFGLPELN